MLYWNIILYRYIWKNLNMEELYQIVNKENKDDQQILFPALYKWKLMVTEVDNLFLILHNIR